MRRVTVLIVGGTLFCTAALAVDREFNDIVGAISDEFHTHPLHVPLLGLVNMVTFVARPAGASHINLAVFENLKTRDNPGRDMNSVIRNAVGRAWTPFVQVHSRREGREETVLVYMRTEGRNCRLLVTSIEPNEATVVELKLNAEGLARWISSPQRSAHSGSGGPEF